MLDINVLENRLVDLKHIEKSLLKARLDFRNQFRCIYDDEDLKKDEQRNDFLNMETYKIETEIRTLEWILEKHYGFNVDLKKDPIQYNIYEINKR